jgi:hypothetical protein
MKGIIMGFSFRVGKFGIFGGLTCVNPPNVKSNLEDCEQTNNNCEEGNAFYKCSSNNHVGTD